MATVKQVLAAISQDGTLGPNQKRIITEAVQRAETWCKLQIGPKPRKISNAKNLITLAEWEEKVRWDTGKLGIWADEKGLDRNVVSSMLREFREEMFAKGKQYADFQMAFRTYLTKGYLSKGLADCVKRDNSGTTIHTKGVNL